MRRIVIVLIVLIGLLLAPMPVYAAGVGVVNTSGDGEWDGDTWSVTLYPNEVKSTTIELHNSSSSNLEVWVSILPDTLDNGNLVFELDNVNLVMDGKSKALVTLTVKASGSTTSGIYTTELEIKSEEAPIITPSGGGGGEAPPRLVTSPDSTTELSIPLSTTIKDKDGRRIYPSNIKITDNPNPPAPPSDTSIIGLTYNFEPSGATFDPPITLTFTYDPGQLPEGVNEGDLVVAFYDEATGEWINLVCVVDTETNTITALVSHFTAFAILVKVPVVEEVIPIPAPEPKPEPVITPPAPEPEPLPEPIPEPDVVAPEPGKPFVTVPLPAVEPDKATNWGVIIGWIVGVFILICVIIVFTVRARNIKKYDKEGGN